VGGVDADEAIDQAQGEAADAALGQVGLQHRSSEGGIPPTPGQGPELETDRLQDLLVEAGREVAVQQVESHDVEQLGLSIKGSQHLWREPRRGILLPRHALPHITLGVEQLRPAVQLPQSVVDQTAVGVGDVSLTTPGTVAAQQGPQDGLGGVNLTSVWRSCLRRARA
jgi:hypothetical protein